MSNTSNFRKAVQDAKSQSLIGPNVIANALPWLGGGLLLTAVGTFGGLQVLQNNPQVFMPTFIGAIVLELILFFVASSVAEKGNNALALPLLATYSLLSGYTLSGLVFLALQTEGVGINGVGFAALGCGVTFIGARSIGSNLSEQDGMALTKTIRDGGSTAVVFIGDLHPQFSRSLNFCDRGSLVCRSRSGRFLYFATQLPR
jgi:FtsH-binding integral membrane protein